jgi:RNA polymerase sigma factor (sigma-70 family)
MNTKELYEKYFLTIRSRVYKIIRDWDDSEDIAQDVFLTYILKAEDLGGDISFLFNIARTKSIDYTRRRKYRIGYLNSNTLEREGYESSIENDVNNALLYNKVYKEIEKFPPGQFKTILEQHYIKGIPMEEISKKLKIAKRTTLNHRINGEKKLREIFGVK